MRYPQYLNGCLNTSEVQQLNGSTPVLHNTSGSNDTKVVNIILDVLTSKLLYSCHQNLNVYHTIYDVQELNGITLKAPHYSSHENKYVRGPLRCRRYFEWDRIKGTSGIASAIMNLPFPLRYGSTEVASHLLHTLVTSKYSNRWAN